VTCIKISWIGQSAAKRLRKFKTYMTKVQRLSYTEYTQASGSAKGYIKFL